MQTNIELKQSWNTLDEAITYFLDVVLDLKALQRLPDPPTDLFLAIDTDDPKIDDKLCEHNYTIRIVSL